MTSKEKALSLVDTFWLYKEGNKIISYQQAMRQAMFCCDELIKEFELFDYASCKDRANDWFIVKSHIEKMIIDIQ